MRRDGLLPLLVRYTLAYGGGSTLVAYWLTVGADASVELTGPLLAGGGLLTAATSLTGTTGTSAPPSSRPPGCTSTPSTSSRRRT